MSDAILRGTNVTICDWRGKVIWQSALESQIKPGDLYWDHLDAESSDNAQLLFARVVTLGEQARLELEDNIGQLFRAWFWPLNRPDSAICILSIAIPKKINSLTDREREILGLLAIGRPTREIADELDVSASTIHTHMRKVRKKLSLPSVESLAGFAARYCHPNAAPH